MDTHIHHFSSILFSKASCLMLCTSMMDRLALPLRHYCRSVVVYDIYALAEWKQEYEAPVESDKMKLSDKRPKMIMIKHVNGIRRENNFKEQKLGSNCYKVEILWCKYLKQWWLQTWGSITWGFSWATAAKRKIKPIRRGNNISVRFFDER